MATISTLAKGNSNYHGTRGGNVSLPYRAEVYIDWAAAATAKGSALAQADVIQCIKVPKGTQVLFAGLEVITQMTGSSTDATLDLGVTGGDVDAFVDGIDLDASVAGTYGTPATAAITPATSFFTAAGTIDLLIVTQTGTITGGVVRVFADLLDCTGGSRVPGIVQLGT